MELVALKDDLSRPSHEDPTFFVFLTDAYNAKIMPQTYMIVTKTLLDITPIFRVYISKYLSNLPPLPFIVKLLVNV